MSDLDPKEKKALEKSTLEMAQQHEATLVRVASRHIQLDAVPGSVESYAQDTTATATPAEIEKLSGDPKASEAHADAFFAKHAKEVPHRARTTPASSTPAPARRSSLAAARADGAAQELRKRRIY